MKIDSEDIINLLKEEYDKRIEYCLDEFKELVGPNGEDYFQNAHTLKVYGPDGSEFSYGGKIEFGGNSFRKLYTEKEPRIDSKEIKSVNTLYEDDIILNDENDLMSDKSEDREFILVSDEDFKKYFTN